MVCGLPSSSTTKSSNFRSVIGLPLSSVATTSTTTSRVVARKTVEDLLGAWVPGAVCAMELGRKPNKKSKRKEADAVRIIPNNLTTAGRNHISRDTGLKGQKGWPAGCHQSKTDCFSSYVTTSYF